jgi:hypothetical protein
MIPVALRGDLDADQVANARTIVSLAKRNWPDWQSRQHAAIIAVATALQESSLRNLETGDRDSVGLFQQRPSQGWGTAQELSNPEIATQKFFDALKQLPDWRDHPIGEVAQEVQFSAYPDAYATQASLARTIVYSLYETSP